MRTGVLNQGGKEMAYNGYAIDEYLDADAVTKQLDELIRKPVYTIRKGALRNYVDNYFEKNARSQRR
jgi:glutamate-1-semialdehyde 2,1-aminomutase